MARQPQNGTIAKFLHGMLKGHTASGRKTIYNVLVMIDHRCWSEKCCVKNTWNGTPLRLDVNHIDGNSHNNDPQNVELLCCNCHSQTPTYKVPHAYR